MLFNSVQFYEPLLLINQTWSRTSADLHLDRITSQSEHSFSALNYFYSVDSEVGFICASTLLLKFAAHHLL